MEENSRESYQKLDDPGELENNNTEKKVNKKCVFITVGIIILIVVGTVVAVVLYSLTSSPSCSEGTYLPSDDDSECYDCSPNCKECKGTKSQSHCTACYDGYSLDDDICVSSFSIKGEYTTTTEGERIYFFNNQDFIDNVENMTIDGDQINPPIVYYVFNTTGNHKVYFKIKSSIKVNDLSSLFSESDELNAVVFSKDFDSTYVTNMNSMFAGCFSLTSVNLGNFITTNVIDMDNMFSTCVELVYVDISKFSTNISDVYLFDGDLPANGSISVTTEFYDKIKEQIPSSWTVNCSDIDIYDLLEN